MDLEEDTKATPSRYLNPEERPSIVRLNISRDESVVGVNYPIDEARFVKRKRRARCGLCNGCRRTDDCGACSNCRGECIKTSCKLRDVLDVSSRFYFIYIPRSKTSFRHKKNIWRPLLEIRTWDVTTGCASTSWSNTTSKKMEQRLKRPRMRPRSL